MSEITIVQVESSSQGISTVQVESNSQGISTVEVAATGQGISTVEVESNGQGIAIIDLHQGATGATGAQGATGATGAQGIPGPNIITTATESNLTGFILANGTTISAEEATSNGDANKGKILKTNGSGYLTLTRLVTTALKAIGVAGIDVQNNDGTSLLRIGTGTSKTGIAEGLGTASGHYSHAKGNNTTASGESAHAEGSLSTASGNSSHAEGYNTTASGESAHAEGQSTIASGGASHAEGQSTTASGIASHAEGSGTHATGNYSHAEGQSTTASGVYSHAEGSLSTASKNSSHAEGYNTTASGNYSHAEGFGSTASGVYSHAEGVGTITSGIASHAEGSETIASGNYSHAAGRKAKAIHNGSRVMSDSLLEDVSSTMVDQMTCRYANGYEFKGGNAKFYGGVLSPNQQLNMESSVVTRATGDARYGTYSDILDADFAVVSDTNLATVLSITLPVGLYQIDAFLSSQHNSAGGCKIRFGATVGGVATNIKVGLNDSYSRPLVASPIYPLSSSVYNQANTTATIVTRSDDGAQEFRRSLNGIVEILTEGTKLSLDYAQKIANVAESKARARSHIIARRIN
jgi:hypothetical protein